MASSTKYCQTATPGTVHSGSRCPLRVLCHIIPGRTVAFTLIELLVVIAIIAILISIMLPTLAEAKLTARKTRELAASSQLMVAMTLYADSNKGRVLTGYPTHNMVNGSMIVNDESGARLRNEMAQRYPWRLAPFLDYNFRGLYQDDNLLREIQRRRSNASGSGSDFNYVVSLYPSFGMNIAFIGGSDRHQQFDRAFVRVHGRVHVERLDEAQRPSELITFISARADEQSALPELGMPQGFFRVEPPYFTRATGRRWEDAYDPTDPSPGTNSGYVSLRYKGKAVSAMFDGHATLLDWEAASDMRHWSGKAYKADWTLEDR